MAVGYATYNEVQCGDRDALVLRHAGLVKKIAYHLSAKLPDSVDVEDLIQSGMIGLLEAASHYKPDAGASFETFAGLRVRGAMIDQLRATGWVPRSVSRQLREMAAAVKKVENRVGREAQSAEVAAEMGISLDEYHSLLLDASTVQIGSLDQLVENSGDAFEESAGEEEVLSELMDEDFHVNLAKQIELLPDKEKLVLALYYDSGLNLKEIGSVMDVSESRVCQIHGQAIVRLKSRMAQWTR